MGQMGLVAVDLVAGTCQEVVGAYRISILTSPSYDILQSQQIEAYAHY